MTKSPITPIAILVAATFSRETKSKRHNYAYDSRFEPAYKADYSAGWNKGH